MKRKFNEISKEIILYESVHSSVLFIYEKSSYLKFDNFTYYDNHFYYFMNVNG